MTHLWVGENELFKLFSGLVIVSVIVILCIFFLTKSLKYKAPFGWIFAHIIILSSTIAWLLHSLRPDNFKNEIQSIAIMSFEMSLFIAGIGWILSMVCLIVAISLWSQHAQNE